MIPDYASRWFVSDDVAPDELARGIVATVRDSGGWSVVSCRDRVAAVHVVELHNAALASSLREELGHLHGVAQRLGLVGVSRCLAQALAAMPADPALPAPAGWAKVESALPLAVAATLRPVEGTMAPEVTPASHKWSAYPHDENGEHGPQGPCELTVMLGRGARKV